MPPELSRPDPPRPAPKVGRCHECGRTAARSDDEILSFVPVGRTRYCWETMALQAEEPGTGREPE